MQTFNYSQHNVCGGPSRRKVTQGPRVSVCVGEEIINLNPTPAKLPKPAPLEGKYVTRAKGSISAGDFMRNRAWAKALRAKQALEVTEPVEDWLKRHHIGEAS